MSRPVAILLEIGADVSAHITGVRALILDDLGVGAGALARLAPRCAREVLVVAVAESRRRREEGEECEELHHRRGCHVFGLLAATASLELLQSSDERRSSEDQRGSQQHQQ